MLNCVGFILFEDVFMNYGTAKGKVLKVETTVLQVIIDHVVIFLPIPLFLQQKPEEKLSVMIFRVSHLPFWSLSWLEDLGP